MTKISMEFVAIYPISGLNCIGQMVDRAIGSNFYTLLETYDVKTISTAEDIEVYEEFLAEFSQLSKQLIVISLNVLVEITLKKILKVKFNTDASKMIFSNLNKAFKRENIALNDIANFSDFDEIRLVSNSLKHHGTVSKELAIANRTLYPKIGEMIVLTNIMVEQYYYRTQYFLQNLCREIAGLDDLKFNSVKS